MRFLHYYQDQVYNKKRKQAKMDFFFVFGKKFPYFMAAGLL